MTRSNRSEESRRVLSVALHPLGGIRTYILYNYPTLVEAGYRFTFVAPANENIEILKRELQSWEGTEFVAVPESNVNYRFVKTVRNLLRSRKYRLVHSHGFSAAAATAIADFGLGVPHVFTSHDVIRPEVQFPGILGRSKRFFFGRLLSRIDRIVTVTDDARENHFRWLPPLSRSGTKVVSIHHGIDTRRFVAPHNGNAGHLREKFGIPPEAFLIGFLGRFMEQKGFLYLIEALERLLADGSINRPVHLLAVGSGDCLVNYRWELDRYPRARAAITFTEFVADVSPVLAEIDLLAMPSLWEACGLLAMEAMCAGVPVLGTDCIGLREVLRGTPSIVVRAADAESLAEGLKQAVNHPWHDAARDFAGEARRRFDVVPAAMKLRDLFDEFP